MSKFSQYFHTLRYVRPSQIPRRLWFKAYHPKPDLRPAPPRRALTGSWRVVPTRAPMLLSPTRFRFLNEEHEVRQAADWQNPQISLLWRYNLHYFEDLFARNADARRTWHRDLIQRWIVENPPGQGVGWDPYPLSLRLCSWIKWALAGHELPPEALHSLAVQMRYLCKRYDYHLFNNHVLVNGKAFIFAGLFFQGAEADRWLAQGTGILNREIPVQILPDGGQFERSPMYQNLIIEDLLDLYNFMRTVDRPDDFFWNTELFRMQCWARALAHPDGQIALFNDAAFGIAPTIAELDEYARSLDLPVSEAAATPLTDFHDSGYLRAALGPAVLFADYGLLGPDFNPGHGHADTLSFELSLKGKRLVVDSGTSTYNIGAERLRQRGTGAHNTILVDGQDSSEVWFSFRVARRAQVHDVCLSAGDQGVYCSAWHDGYKRLPGGVWHERTWRLTPTGLEIQDELGGGGQHDVQVTFHFHPEVKLSRADDHVIKLSRDGQMLADLILDDIIQVNIEDSSYHPEFGRSIPNQKVMGRYRGHLPITVICKFAWILQ